MDGPARTNVRRTARLGLVAALVTVTMVLAGCAETADYRPGEDFELTGRHIQLKASVVDWLDTQVYPGLQANLWAFCFEPADPNDAVSAAAIEGWARLDTDARGSTEDQRKNCGVPGPTIRVKQGDKVTVEFGHSHFHAHTIHWHGQYVTTENDGAPGVSQEATPSGGSTTYEFIAKKAGTLWYHCHVDTQFHVMQGLYGMFIVEPAEDVEEVSDVDAEYKMVLGTMSRSIVEAIPGVALHAHGKGCLVSGTVDCQNPPMDTEPDVFTINGRSLPLTMDDPDTLYTIKEGGKIRIRILNAGNTAETIHPHGQDMLVTHRDGNPLPAPFWVDTLLIGPAERYDVIIEGTNPGAWMLHTHVNNHETNDGQSPGGMHTMLVYEGFEDKMHQHRAELVGGLPYMEPVWIPDDRVFSHVIPLGTQGVPLPGGLPGAPAPLASVVEEWRIPIELACAARTVKFTATLGGGAASARLTSLGLSITDADGKPRGDMSLGGSSESPTEAPVTTVTWNATQVFDGKTFPGMPQGDFLVAISGTAAESTLHLLATVDYFSSYDEMKLSHKLHKTPLCGTYGNGNDGFKPSIPPP